MFATGIVGAFIVIGAKTPSMVQLEASGTETLEAAEGINTLARFRTNTWLLAFIYVCKKNMLQEAHERRLFHNA